MFVVRRSWGVVRMFNSGKSGIEDVVKNKGKADEDLYFSRKDKETLKALMSKLDHAIPEDSSNPEILKKNRDTLLGIMRKHNMRPSDGLIEDILTWKKSDY